MVVTVLICAILGVCAGLAVAWGGIALEKWERLEETEAEEREAFEREQQEQLEQDREKGKVKSHYPEWPNEVYGWQWQDRILAPIAGAGGFALLGFHDHDLHVLILQCIWTAVLVHVAVFDLKHRLVLNVVTYPAIVLGLAASFITPGLSITTSLAGAVLVGMFFLLPALLRQGSVGLGDVKLGLFIGAVTGFWLFPPVTGAVVALFWGAVLGGAASLVTLVVRRRGMHDTLAYAPYLCLGTLIAFLLAQ